jgi:hypothetical protein
MKFEDIKDLVVKDIPFSEKIEAINQDALQLSVFFLLSEMEDQANAVFPLKEVLKNLESILPYLDEDTYSFFFNRLKSQPEFDFWLLNDDSLFEQFNEATSGAILSNINAQLQNKRESAELLAFLLKSKKTSVLLAKDLFDNDFPKTIQLDPSELALFKEFILENRSFFNDEYLESRMAPIDDNIKYWLLDLIIPNYKKPLSELVYNSFEDKKNLGEENEFLDKHLISQSADNIRSLITDERVAPYCKELDSLASSITDQIDSVIDFPEINRDFVESINKITINKELVATAIIKKHPRETIELLYDIKDEYAPDCILKYFDQNDIQNKNFKQIRELINLNDYNFSNEELIEAMFHYLSSHKHVYDLDKVNKWAEIKHDLFKKCLEAKLFEDLSDYLKFDLEPQSYLQFFGLEFVFRNFHKEFISLIESKVISLDDSNKKELKNIIKLEHKKEEHHWHGSDKKELTQVGLKLGLFTNKEIIKYSQQCYQLLNQDYYNSAPRDMIDLLAETDDFDMTCVLSNPHLTIKERQKIIKKIDEHKITYGYNNNLFDHQFSAEELDFFWSKIKGKNNKDLKHFILSVLKKQMNNLSQDLKNELESRVLKIKDGYTHLINGLDSYDKTTQNKIFTAAISSPENALNVLCGFDFTSFLDKKNIARCINSISKDEAVVIQFINSDEMNSDNFSTLLEIIKNKDFIAKDNLILAILNSTKIPSSLKIDYIKCINKSREIYLSSNKVLIENWGSDILLAIAPKINLNFLNDKSLPADFDNYSNDPMYWTIMLKQNISLQNVQGLIKAIENPPATLTSEQLKEQGGNLFHHFDEYKSDPDYFIIANTLLNFSLKSNYQPQIIYILGKETAISGLDPDLAKKAIFYLVENESLSVEMLLKLKSLISSIEFKTIVIKCGADKFIKDLKDCYEGREYLNETPKEELISIFGSDIVSKLDKVNLSVTDLISSDLTSDQLNHFLHENDDVASLNFARMTKEQKIMFYAKINSTKMNLNAFIALHQYNKLLGYSSDQMEALIFNLDDPSFVSLVSNITKYKEYFKNFSEDTKQKLFSKLQDVKEITAIDELLLIIPANSPMRLDLIKKCKSPDNLEELLKNPGLSPVELEAITSIVINLKFYDNFRLSYCDHSYLDYLLNALVSAQQFHVTEEDGDLVAYTLNSEVSRKKTESTDFNKYLNQDSKTIITKEFAKLEKNYPEEISGDFALESKIFTPDLFVNKELTDYLKTPKSINTFSEENEEILQGLLKFTPIKSLKALAKRQISESKPLYNIYIVIPDSMAKNKKKYNYDHLIEAKSSDLREELNNSLKISPERTFGFELELSANRSKKTVAEKMKEATDNRVSVKNEYGRSSGNSWDVKQDGSVREAGGYAMEITSPILQGEAGILEATKILNKIFSELKIVSGQTCNGGLHIHHGIKDLLKAQKDLKLIMSKFYTFQEALYQLCANWRQDNHYCQRLFNEKIEKDEYKLESRSGFNITDLGTLEFRMRESMQDSSAIIRWIKITQKLVLTIISSFESEAKEYKKQATDMLDVMEQERILQLKDANLEKETFLEQLNRYNQAKIYSENLIGL